MSFVTRVPCNMWAHTMGKSVFLSLCLTGESRVWFWKTRCRRKATILQCIVICTHLAMKYVVSTSMYCYNFLADTLLTTRAGCVPCITVAYTLIVIRQNFAHRRVWIAIDDGITVQLNSKRLGKINKSSPRSTFYSPRTLKCDACFRAACNVQHG